MPRLPKIKVKLASTSSKAATGTSAFTSENINKTKKVGFDAAVKTSALKIAPRIAGKYFTPLALYQGARDLKNLGKAAADAYSASKHQRNTERAAQTFIRKKERQMALLENARKGSNATMLTAARNRRTSDG